MKNPTMQQIAEAAGVSRMTVSRSLRNQSCIPQATRRRIQKVARQLGYRINPLVSAWMSSVRSQQPSRSLQIIAFITSREEEYAWTHYHSFSRFYRGAIERGTRLGYRIEPFWYDRHAISHSRLSQILHTRSIRGALLTAQPDIVQPVYLDWERFALATAGSAFFTPALHQARNHQFSTMQLALRALFDRGYRRIGLALALSDDERVCHEWRGAYLAERSVNPKIEPIPPLWFPFWDMNHCRPLFERWLKKERPDAVLSIHEELPEWMLALGYRIPQKIGYAHLDLSPEKCPRFAGMDQNHEQVGAAAVDLIVNQLNQNECGIPTLPKTTIISGQWKEGPTVRKLA